MGQWSFHAVVLIAELKVQLEPVQNGAWVFKFLQKPKTSTSLECRHLEALSHSSWRMGLWPTETPRCFCVNGCQARSLPSHTHVTDFFKPNSRGLWFYLSRYWTRQYTLCVCVWERERTRTGGENFLLAKAIHFWKSSFGMTVEPVYVPYKKISLSSL